MFVRQNLTGMFVDRTMRIFIFGIGDTEVVVYFVDSFYSSCVSGRQNICGGDCLILFTEKNYGLLWSCHID